MNQMTGKLLNDTKEGLHEFCSEKKLETPIRISRYVIYSLLFADCIVSGLSFFFPQGGLIVFH